MTLRRSSSLRLATYDLANKGRKKPFGNSKAARKKIADFARKNKTDIKTHAHHIRWHQRHVGGSISGILNTK